MSVGSCCWAYNYVHYRSLLFWCPILLGRSSAMLRRGIGIGLLKVTYVLLLVRHLHFGANNRLSMFGQFGTLCNKWETLSLALRSLCRKEDQNENIRKRSRILESTSRTEYALYNPIDRKRRETLPGSRWNPCVPRHFERVASNGIVARPLDMAKAAWRQRVYPGCQAEVCGGESVERKMMVPRC